MYNKSYKDPAVAVVTAAMGAGTVAWISVSLGQNVLVGLGITAFSTALALVVDQLFFQNY
jgi:predicted anti-sigma-YlaC factor YlaD